MRRKVTRHPYSRITKKKNLRDNASTSDKSSGFKDGYRPNVGIIVTNSDGKVLWGRRVKHDGWQFPQGGIEPKESVLDAAYRELFEEIGLEAKHVELLGHTEGWMRYDLPKKANYHRKGAIRGQKQAWVLFKLVSSDNNVRLNLSEKPEFDDWRWVDYWQPLNEIIPFKKQVYTKALQELRPLLESYLLDRSAIRKSQSVKTGSYHKYRA